MDENKPPTYEHARRQMVAEQLVDRDIDDERVLAAMQSVPRHLFMPPEYRYMAYADGPMPIGEGQTISQPYIVALMTQMLHLNGTERVLEVGTGSGYQAAVLAGLAAEIHTVERHESLARQAAETLRRLGYHNVYVHLGDGSHGWPEAAPYQAIIVTAAAPRAPQPLLEQLADGGRLVIPVGQSGSQFLEYWERRGANLEQQDSVPVAFVPLRGDYGWNLDAWADAPDDSA